jgi:hypothetical protein
MSKDLTLNPSPKERDLNSHLRSKDGTENQNIFLFSVDLEDVREFIPDGKQYKEAVPANTIKYLDWLDKVNAKATFFIVGTVAPIPTSLGKSLKEATRQPHILTRTCISPNKLRMISGKIAAIS